jgi:hypothetical protein
MAIADPPGRRPAGAARPTLSWAKAMPPLWQYFLRLRKEADESIAAPKGHGPPDPAAFPLQTGGFLGTTMGAMTAVVDPQASRRREWWAKAMPRCGSTSRVC